MGRDQGEADSVYDFLYVDQRRIGMLLSQFGENGVLTEIVREAASGSETGSGLDIRIIKVSGKEKEDTKQSRKFDPQWLIPLLFLDQTQKRVVRELRTASLGQLVLIEGTAVLVDTQTHQQLYQTPAARDLSLRNAQAVAQAAGQPFDEQTHHFEVEVLAGMSRQVQLHLLSKEGWTWSTLRPEGLITPASELGLNHGAVINGDWHMVGIKDAAPENSYELMQTQQRVLNERFAGNPFYREIVTVNLELRKAMGRPVDSYGITPLLIFRAIQPVDDGAAEG